MTILWLILTGGVSRKRKLDDPESPVQCKSEFTLLLVETFSSSTFIFE